MLRMKTTTCALTFLLLFPTFSLAKDAPPAWPILVEAGDREPLPGTGRLDWEGDLASRMVDGIDRFLLKEIAATVGRRAAYWQRDGSSSSAYAESIAPNRQRLAEILGTTRDARPKNASFEYVDRSPEPRAVGEGFVVRQVRWRAFGDVHGIGLLLEPVGEALVDVVAIPDANQSPEEIAGFGEGQSPTNSYALQLARLGCRVLVPTLISRAEHEQKMSHREWLHRGAFILGRTLAGYETLKVMAGVDCLLASQGDAARKVAVVGWGEGGRIALYAAALDTRIDAACVSGYFAPREKVWNEPADRTVFRLLREFGDAELATLVAPRRLIVETGLSPSYVYRPDENGEPEVRETTYSGGHGKPGRLIAPTRKAVETEFGRLQTMVAGLGAESQPALMHAEKPLEDATLLALLEACGAGAIERRSSADFNFVRKDKDAAAERHEQQTREMDRHNQWAIIDSRRVRAEKFEALQTDSLVAYQKSVEPLRREFRDEVVGRFARPLSPANARTRKYQEGTKTVSYEVVLDVFPDVFAYGILTLPKNFGALSGERRPVVVCQHGLEGRPQDVVSEPAFHYYQAFATRLAERGFVTFAPQNIYIFYDRFRTLQFKAFSVGCTLYSIMVPQHEQITGWLAAQKYVDPERIAFYGLSYGGKSAMRIPPLVERYCLSICSADYNEWVWKNAATDPLSLRYSYANKGEYEIFEFNLGGTFNYAEMAALICPRPFMVERGHFDGVAPDETVAYEYAKVRHLYQAKLGIGERTEIDWFVGPHSIHGEGTFEFLEKWLDWQVED